MDETDPTPRKLRRITAPAATPISLTEAKAHLRVSGSTDDTLITALVDAATQHLDGWAGTLSRALVTQTWEVLMDAFPPGREIELPLGPVQSVTSVVYTDEDGGAQTMAGADYALDAAAPIPRIVLGEDASWPSTDAIPNAVVVRFVCGYGAAADVPAPIRAAALLIVGDLYRNREAASDVEILPNPTVDRLLSPYRIVGA